MTEYGPLTKISANLPSTILLTLSTGIAALLITKPAPVPPLALTCTPFLRLQFLTDATDDTPPDFQTPRPVLQQPRQLRFQHLLGCVLGHGGCAWRDGVGVAESTELGVNVAGCGEASAGAGVLGGGGLGVGGGVVVAEDIGQRGGWVLLPELVVFWPAWGGVDLRVVFGPEGVVSVGGYLSAALQKEGG